MHIGWIQCDYNNPHKKEAGGVKGRGVGNVITGAVMGVMNVGDGEKGYPAACKEHRQALEAEKTNRFPLQSQKEPTC